MKTIFRGQTFTVEAAPFVVNKRKFVFDRIRVSDAVVILPVFDDGKILLEKQYRFVIGKTIYELAAGMIDRGEKPMAAAGRELEEEQGYAAGKLRLMFKAYPNPGRMTETLYYYLATDLKKTKADPDPNEVIAPCIVTYDRALRMIKNGTIRDGKTIAGLLYYGKFIRKR